MPPMTKTSPMKKTQLTTETPAMAGTPPKAETPAMAGTPPKAETPATPPAKGEVPAKFLSTN